MKSSFQWLVGLMVLAAVAVGAFSGGFIAGWLVPQSPSNLLPKALTTAIPQNSSPDDAAKSTDELFVPFWEAWKIVNQQYVDQPVDQEQLMRGAIRGMVAGLGDQHSSYMDPEEYRQANLPMDGEYEGIGAWVDTTGAYLRIIEPMPGSPAEKAGLRPGDEVIRINGEDMTGIDGSLVLRRVLGPGGTQVTLTIRRESETEPFDVSITRAKIDVPSVESRMLDNQIAYVHLFSYGEKTTTELKAALKALMAEEPKGLILDLRNNGGGYLVTAIDVVSQFIDKGVVMFEEYGDGSRKEFKAKSGGLATNVPLIVLINGGTASASEITAGAIQDLGRGKLVGEKSFGKGSVQNWIPLSGDEGAVRVTIARWLTPNGTQIHGVGLTPDVAVEFTEQDMEAGRDPQLEKAVDLLSAP